MSDTLKSILIAAGVLIGFALIWAVAMPTQTNAWNGFGYWGGVLGLWALVSIGIFIGNKIADRNKNKGILPMLALLLLLGATSCATKPAVQQERPAPKVDVYDTTDAQGNDQQVVAQRAW